jgi:hypothetical protein
MTLIAAVKINKAVVGAITIPIENYFPLRIHLHTRFTCAFFCVFQAEIVKLESNFGHIFQSIKY